MSTIEVDSPRRPSKWGGSLVMVALLVAMGILIYDALAKRPRPDHMGTMMPRSSQPTQPAPPPPSPAQGAPSNP